jgi:addiction module HigA family antidote
MLKNPSHPGEILHDEVLPYHGVSSIEAAAILEIDQKRLDRVLAGRAPIDRDLAERIEAAWGVSAELMVSAQRHYDEARHRRHRDVPGRVTIGVVALLTLAGIVWQAVSLWRMLT